MAKKRLRKKLTSKGIHSTMNTALIAAVRANRDPIDNGLVKLRAWKKLLNPWLTVANPYAKTQTNKPFIRVKANDYWGNPKQERKGPSQSQEVAAG